MIKMVLLRGIDDLVSMLVNESFIVNIGHYLNTLNYEELTKIFYPTF